MGKKSQNESILKAIVRVEMEQERLRVSEHESEQEVQYSETH